MKCMKRISVSKLIIDINRNEKMKVFDLEEKTSVQSDLLKTLFPNG